MNKYIKKRGKTNAINQSKTKLIRMEIMWRD